MTRMTKIGMVAAVAVALGGCTKTTTDSTAGSKLRIVTSTSGQKQTITANIDNNGYVNFNPQQLMADGGSPAHTYTWSLDGTAPAGVTLASLTGVISRNGTSTNGISAGNTTINVKVSDGTSEATGSVTLLVTNYTPGPTADFQQLSTAFTLVDGVANKAYGASLFVMGGTPPYSWHLDETYSGSADLTSAGLTVDASSGIVRGTILQAASGKVVHFRVVVTDNAGETAVYSPVYTINIK